MMKLSNKKILLKKTLLACFAWLLILFIALPNIRAGVDESKAIQSGASVVADINSKLQTIDGFGVSDAWRTQDIKRLSEPERTELLDLIFSADKGAGLSILRHRIDPYFHLTPKSWFPDALEEDVWMTKEARKRGVVWVMASVWTPPAWMKSNNSDSNGGNVKKEFYPDFAEYLSNYAAEMRKAGAPVDIISMQNEPDLATSYESCQWSSDEAIDFIKNYWAPRWLADKRTETAMWGEQCNWSSSQSGVSAVMADPKVASFIKAVGGHSYQDMKVGPVNGDLTAKKVDHSWMTEVSNMTPDDPSITDGLAWAEYIQHTLYSSTTNAINYWWIFQRHGRDIQPSGEGLINLEQAGSKVTIRGTKRLWTFAQFSRFVRPGFRLLKAISSGVTASAFSSADGNSVILVLINNSPEPVDELKVNIPGVKLKKEGQLCYTSDQTNLEQDQITMINDEHCILNLKPRSVSTLVLKVTGK